MKLTNENVIHTAATCLFGNDESTEGVPVTEVHAVNLKLVFHKERLNSVRDTVMAFLKQLPKELLEQHPEGTSVVFASLDQNGELWGNPLEADTLIVLGLGLDLIRFTCPRGMWPLLPGGLAHITLHIN